VCMDPRFRGDDTEFLDVVEMTAGAGFYFVCTFAFSKAVWQSSI
jgi:hypothetical protein